MIVSLYGTLMEISPFPIIAMNRAIAVAHRDGPEQGLEELSAIEGQDRLSRYPFYAAAFGELEFRLGRKDTAKRHFQAARALARSAMERQFLDRRIDAYERDELVRQSLSDR